MKMPGTAVGVMRSQNRGHDSGKTRRLCSGKERRRRRKAGAMREQRQHHVCLFFVCLKERYTDRDPTDQQNRSEDKCVTERTNSFFVWCLWSDRNALFRTTGRRFTRSFRNGMMIRNRSHVPCPVSRVPLSHIIPNNQHVTCYVRINHHGCRFERIE